MSKTAEVYLFVFILLVILYGVFLMLKHPPSFVRGGQEVAVPQTAPHLAAAPHPAAPPPKKHGHHIIKTVAKTGLMVAPLALLAL